MDDLRARFGAAMGLLRSVAIYRNPVLHLRWRRLYRTLLSRGELAFDVGAHVGTRARAMRSAGARVVAFEPQTVFAAYLRRTMPRDVAVLDVALGREEAEATMAVSSRHPTVSSLSREFVDGSRTATGFEHVRWDRSQPVRVVTLDDVIARFGRPAYVKIDTEGSEGEVLAGLSHPVDLISVEYLPAFPRLAASLVDLLVAKGNDRFNVVEGETGRFLWREWRDGDAVKTWLACRKTSARSGDLFARRGRDMPRPADPARR